MKKKPFNLFYAIVVLLGGAVWWIWYRFRFEGRKNLPKDGPLLICPNHLKADDPFFLTFAYWPERLCYLAKEELFKKRFVAALLRFVGCYPVRNNGNDTLALMAGVIAVRAGQKVLVFPEGHRVHEDEGDPAPFAGVGYIALKERVPVLPVFLERRKKGFCRLVVHIGEVLRFDCEGKPTREDYAQAARTIMQAVRSMRDRVLQCE